MKDLVVALVATLAVQAASSVTVYTPAILAPAAHDAVGVAASAIGLFTTTVYGFAALAAPVGGTFVARRGAVRVSQYCLLLGGIGLALAALAHPLAVLLGAALIGAGYGPVTPASSALLVERTPPRVRNLVMSIRQTGVPVGGAFAGAVVPLLIVVVGWRGATLAMAALCAALAAGLQVIRAAYDRPQAGVSGARPSIASMLRMVLAHRGLRQASLSSFMYAGIQLCFTSYLVVFLTERADWSVIDAGFALSAAMIGGIVGRVVWGAIADRVGSARRVLGALGVVMAACAFAMTQITAAWPPAAVVALCIVFGATAVGWNGVYIAEVARIAPEGQVALATGASLAVTYFGVVVAPFVFWLVLAATASYALAFGLVGLATFAAALPFFRRI